MNKKRYIAIFVLIMLVILTILGISKANSTSKLSYKNKSYTGENENWRVSLEVRDKQLDIKVTPKILTDKDSKIQCQIKTGPQYSSSGVISYGSTFKSFRATVGLIVDPINYKNEVITITYNDKADSIILNPLKE
ncbi:hypothetical protein [Clostridium folliculivorans]|uniref:Uncharacterized protein n=1 Tax=Clostridium folliculivorans TaxID=2886038 RepID=A0A9W5Y2Z1_9CLOT|nr:hypothetical protein [Clostridium folliculivorans]GKU25497.1 hypothetical protein CFOLD11_23230 [Clostridium folliculivorans]GKU28520.1 hypothetical protein CFB3_06260 [Clostridium folliculivorans]